MGKKTGHTTTEQCKCERKNRERRQAKVIYVNIHAK